MRWPSSPPCVPAERGALRAGERQSKEASLRPTAAADRPARRSRPLPGSRARSAYEHTLAASPSTPEDSAGCRHGCRLASTASRSCTRRGPMRHRPSRPIDLSRGAASSSAHDLQIWACFARSPRMVQLVSALLRQAARSSPVVNGRTERRPIEAASRQRRWALGLSGRIAAGGPGLPLSAALGVECSVRVSAPTISTKFDEGCRE